MTLNNVLLALLLAATFADHVSTNVFLKRAARMHLREGNRLLAKIIERWGSTGLFVAKLASFLAVLAVHHNFWDALAPVGYFHWGPLPPLFLASCVGVLAATTAYNVYRIQR